MFCLQVHIAHPDYKRPYVSVFVEHFSTQEKAEQRLNQIKLEYINDFDVRNDNDDLVSLDEFNKMLENGSLSDRIYCEWYIDQEPFYGRIFEVKNQQTEFFIGY